VPHGKACPQTAFINIDTQYLKAPPTKLPAPTISNDFSINQKIFKLLHEANIGNIAQTRSKKRHFKAKR